MEEKDIQAQLDSWELYHQQWEKEYLEARQKYIQKQLEQSHPDWHYCPTCGKRVHQEPVNLQEYFNPFGTYPPYRPFQYSSPYKDAIPLDLPYRDPNSTIYGQGPWK